MSSFSHKISNSVTNWSPETEVSFITSLTWLRRTCLRTTTRSSDNMLLLMMNKIVFMFVNQSEFRMSKNQNEYNDNTDYNCKKTARSSTLGGSYGIDESRFGGHRTWCHYYIWSSGDENITFIIIVVVSGQTFFYSCKIFVKFSKKLLSLKTLIILSNNLSTVSVGF